MVPHHNYPMPLHHIPHINSLFSNCQFQRPPVNNLIQLISHISTSNILRHYSKDVLNFLQDISRIWYPWCQRISKTFPPCPQPSPRMNLNILNYILYIKPNAPYLFQPRKHAISNLFFKIWTYIKENRNENWLIRPRPQK